MSENEEYSYLGVEDEAGKISVDGPLSEGNLKKKMKKESDDKTLVGVKADKKGNAILKILISLINGEKSK